VETSEPGLAPEPIAFALPDYGLTVRGQHWRGDANWVVLVHAPGADLDAWGDLPEEFATAGYDVLAFDLPGHGLSDGDWEPRLLPRSIAAALAFAGEAGARRRFLVTAGVAAGASLAALSRSLADAWIALSPIASDGELAANPSVPVPKLILVGAADPAAVEAAEQLYHWSTGWTVSSTFGGAENGTRLLRGDWAGQAREQMLKFLNDYRVRGGPNAGLQVPRSRSEAG
jgi:pimeloyl-ACP methyl ester carboxylesterase